VPVAADPVKSFDDKWAGFRLEARPFLSVFQVLMNL